MRADLPGVWRLLPAALGIWFAVALVGGALFVWSGIYNVSAARDHFAVTTWILEQLRDRSVATHSSLIAVPPLDDPDMIRLGAAHFESVCVLCHARPGEDANAVVRHMLPPPPDLSVTLRENTPEEIFWVVKHGLKYTGMPAFPTQVRNDEVWAVTAFLSDLPKGEPHERYRTLAGLDRLPEEGQRPAGESPMRGSGTAALTQCIRCHDDAHTATQADLVPRLAGQSPDYLRRALAEYASGERPSGIMQPVADALDRASSERLITYYNSLPPMTAGVMSDPAAVERGRVLATRGDARSGLPACIACHGGPASPQFPRLAGQNAHYLEAQLTLWRNGGRARTTFGQIMAPIARRLSAEQARDAAAYFASLAGGPSQPVPGTVPP